MEIKPIKYGHSEVNPWTDGKDRDFHGFETKDWAKDTGHLAKNSVNFHLAELLLKIPSYFIFKSDLKDQWWAKVMFVIERMTGTFGDMFRNFIYGHKDKDGKRDDNVGLETHAGSYDKLAIGEWNYHAQTKGKFITSILGFISPELANDLEWAIIRSLDSIWWRNMGIHLAHGPTYGKQLFNKFFGDSKDTKSNINIFKNAKDHFNNAQEAWKKYRSGKESKNEEEKSNGFLNFCQYTDKVASSFMPIVNALNLIGDFGRPIARRLGITGISRNAFRILSVIDKPFFWFTHLFRFYLPEKFTQKEEGINRSDLLLGGVAADVIDFGLLVFEDKIKDTSGSLNQFVELARKFKDSAYDIYFSARRKRGLEELGTSSD